MHFSTGAAACLLLASVMATPMPSPPADDGLGSPLRSLHRREEYYMKMNPEDILPDKTGDPKVDAQKIYDWYNTGRRLEGMPDDFIAEQQAARRAFDETGQWPVREDHRGRQYHPTALEALRKKGAEPLTRDEIWAAARKNRKEYKQAKKDVKKYNQEKAAREAQAANKDGDGDGTPPPAGGVVSQEGGGEAREKVAQSNPASLNPMVLNAQSGLSNFQARINEGVKGLRSYDWGSMARSNPLPYLAAITQQRVPAAVQAAARAPRPIGI